MIKLGNTVLLDNYIKGIKKRPDCMKVYFIDNTAKCFYNLIDQTNLEQYIDEMGFKLEKDNYTDDEFVKIYFPDNTATKTMLDEDGFDDLVAWFLTKEY